MPLLQDIYPGAPQNKVTKKIKSCQLSAKKSGSYSRHRQMTIKTRKKTPISNTIKLKLRYLLYQSKIFPVNYRTPIKVLRNLTKNGVASVDIVGGQEREIKIELDNRIVYQNSISLLQLSQILAAENVDIPGGNFKRSTQEYTARLKGKYPSLEALKNLEINTPYGKKKLGKIANIADGGEEVKIRSTFFENATKSKENNVVILSVIKAKDGNTVELAKKLETYPS